MAEIFDPNQRHSFEEWFKSENPGDLDPNAAYRALGVAPGTGKWPTREELNPGFLDKALNAFGIETDKVKNLKALQIKQQQLEPFINEMVKLKAVDQLHKQAQMRLAPTETGQDPAIDATFRGAQPQPFPGGGFGSPAGPMTPQMGGLQPAPTMGDPAMAGMPLGASSVQAEQVMPPVPQSGPFSYFPGSPGAVRPAGAASMQYGPTTLDQGGQLMTPDALARTPMKQAQEPGIPGTPNPMNYGDGFDYQGRPIPPQPQAELIPQPIRAEPIAAPMPRAAQPMAAPRPYSERERLNAAAMLANRNAGHLLPDETGRLVPASMVMGENKMLKAPDIERAAEVFGVPGLQVAPGTRLPVGLVQGGLTQRLKSTHETMPEIVKLQNQLDKLPDGSPHRAELQARIDRLKTNGQASTDEIAAAQREFAKLPAHLQTSQNASLIGDQHKGVPVEEIMKGAKNPNQPLVNVNTGVTASEEAAKEFMKSTRASYDQLKSAPTALQNIEEAKRLIPSAKGFMGPGGEVLLDAAKFLNNRLGTKIDTAGIKDAEELRSRIFFNIMDSLKKMDAQPSEMQQRVMMDSLGKLGTDPNALSNVLDAFGDSIRGKVDQHNSEVSSAESRGTRFPYNPVIKLPPRKAAAAAASGQSEPARIQTDDDYSKLPSGALFIGPDGKTRRKP